MKKSPIITAICILWVFAICIPTFAQNNTNNPKLSIFQKLVKEDITKIQLAADFEYLFENKRENQERKAKLTLTKEDGTKTPMQIKIRPRGVFRRNRCEIPPLRLNFNKEVLAQMGLDSTFDKLKLVTHCVENKSAEQVLLREYWAYKLYNKITPHSFKVHLIHITYINTENPEEQTERLAFLIENNKEMAKRIGGELVENYGLTPSKLKAGSIQNTMLFNYMIGNLDWHLQRNRNIKQVQLKDSGRIAIVPYDFDMSALVFPSYARLNPDYNQKRFTDRYSVRRFDSEQELSETISKFQKVERNFLTDFKSCAYLTSESKNKMVMYIKGFYKTIDKKKKWDRFL